MTVIGPNGRDVYAVSIIFILEDDTTVEHFPFLCEALSQEEAVGIGWLIANQTLVKYSTYSRCLQVKASDAFYERGTTFSVFYTNNDQEIE